MIDHAVETLYRLMLVHKAQVLDIREHNNEYIIYTKMPVAETVETLTGAVYADYLPVNVILEPKNENE